MNSTQRKAKKVATQFLIDNARKNYKWRCKK